MVELQPCATLVNASALCAIEEEVKGEGIDVIAEISAELQRERQTNAELMERISVLEAQIQERDKSSLVTDKRGGCPNTTDKSFKKFKRVKIEKSGYKIEEGDINESIEMGLQMKHETQCRLVNWMSMSDIQFLHFEKFGDGDSAADCDDTDDRDDEDDDYYGEDDIDIDHKDRENYDNSNTANKLKEDVHEEGANEGIHIPCMGTSSTDLSKPTFSIMSNETNEDQKKDSLPGDSRPIQKKRELKRHDKKETKMIARYKTSSKIFTSGQEAFHKGSGSTSLHGKPLKVAFCPKEVKRIIESEALLLKNAQSHTIRKIIVFASLGIRHGCEDLYELDFNHFSILRKGEPYMSPDNPGEHVLYENPGVRRKVFYPNQQNPTLCPVQILEEEKAMRPSDASCPSCLFLCIKYGGTTRNLPQNEYVRQRMGRTKLKSFGPVMCQMAMLVHIRCGSFFFKALGITLLFMAGFPDDLVQQETKYRNLDLLQKYYRTDEDAEGEELFLLNPIPCDTRACPNSQQLTEKTISTKYKGKKQPNSVSKPHNFHKASILHSASSRSAPSTQSGLMGYSSIHTQAMAAFQSMLSQIPVDTRAITNPVLSSSSPPITYRNQTPHPIFPPQPANAFMPVVYWPFPNALPPCPYPSSYGYQSFSSTGNHMSFLPQPYYGQPSCNPFIPKMEESPGKNGVAMEEAESDPDSSSRITQPENELASCK